MEQKRKNKNILIFVLLIAVASLSIAFATFSQELSIEGVVKILSQGTWDISFEKIKSFNTSGYATGTGSKTETEKTITFSCEFVAYGDTCSLTAVIANRGDIDAIFKGYQLIVTENGQEVYNDTELNFSDETITIDFENTMAIDSLLSSGDRKDASFTVKLNDDGYAATTDVYTIKIKYNFEQVTK